MSDQTEFGNEQEMAVADKERPTLGPTEGSQDVSERAVQVVPMPAHTNPNDPMALSASVNLALNDSPVEHAEDYGDAALSTVGDAGTENAMSEAARELRAEGEHQRAAGADALAGAPEDRAEWEKKHWSAQASALGLATSGNKGDLKKRVEAHEKAEAKAAKEQEEELEAAKALNAGDWISQAEGAKDADELRSLRELYDRSGADYSTAVDAFDAKQAEFDGTDNNDGS
jgi:nitrogen fixation protein FixH